jgi:predicted O-linked N-acetylglucosamine transferase (SPINDLY family)
MSADLLHPGNAAVSVPQAMEQAAAAYGASEWARAEQLCRTILQRQAGHFDALSLLGAVAAQTGRTDEALPLLERAVAIRPHDATAHVNYGNVLKDLGRLDESLESYQRAVALRPDFAEAYFNLANTLQELRRLPQALDGYQRALHIRPDYAQAYNNRGNALKDLGRLDEALDSFGCALQLLPEFAEIHYNRGNALQDLRRHGEALDSYEQALLRKPDYEWLYGLWLYTRLHLCEWRDLDSQIASLVDRVRQGLRATPPFLTLALVDSPALQRQSAQIWADSLARSRPLEYLAKRPRAGKIRLGYFSTDFHAHATAYLIAELIEQHDRGEFEVVAFSFGPDSNDDMRKRLTAAFDRFIDVRLRSDREVAELSRELGIDIALDLKGYTQDARSAIFAHRAAPIQVNYLGYPGTLGVPYIDYLVADATVIPPESRMHYLEKIVYLPHSYQVNDRQRPIADRRFSREELGLPRNDFVFCCFNNAFKITPEAFGIWMRLLQEVPGSVLWLLQDNPIAASNLRREAELRGVEAQRLVFAPRLPLPQHLARHRAADLFLDTLPYNAHTTASDALWAGLPVLTRLGESFVARVAGSLLNAIGLPELITRSAKEYEALALELATRPARLAELRARLERNRLTQPLFDTPVYARHLEEAYRRMHERYQADMSPQSIEIAP